MELVFLWTPFEEYPYVYRKSNFVSIDDAPSLDPGSMVEEQN